MTQGQQKTKILKRRLRLKIARTRIGDLLLASGRINERDLDRALQKQQQEGGKIGAILVRDNRITRLDLLSCLSRQVSTRLALTCVGVCLLASGSAIHFAKAQQTTYSYPPTQVAYSAVPPRAAIDHKPAGLFGRTEVLSTNIKAFTKWTGVLARMGGRDNSARALEKEFAAYGLGSIDDLAKAPLQERITHINNVVNKLRYVEDRDHYGKTDYWATPTESAKSGVADCEDYAIAKYALLKAAGVPENMLRVSIVKDMQKNIPHAVLVVYDPQRGPEILDNQSQYVREASAISWYTPLYSINAQAWWRHI